MDETLVETLDTVAALSAALMSAPRDHTLYLALVDAFMEQRGCARSTAERHVRAKRRYAQDSADVRAAELLLGGTSARSRRARVRCHQIRDTTCPPAVPVSVAPGDAGPTMSGEPPRSEFKNGGVCQYPGAARRAGYKIRYIPDTRVVTVGARFVLAVE